MRDGKVMKVTGTQRRSKEKPGHYLRMGGRVLERAGAAAGAGGSQQDKGGHPSNKVPEKQQGDVSGTGASAGKRT